MRTRTSLILLLLCALVCGQTASIVSEQFHQHSSHHCCGLCHAGMPFVQASTTAALIPAASSVWLEAAHGVDSAHEVPLSTGSSRAPPA